MKPRTGAVRALLVVLFGGVLLAAAALWLISYESAAMFPEYAQLRLPVYLIAVAGAVPVVIAFVAMWRLLDAVDAGEAFSPAALGQLRTLRWQLLIFVLYYAVAFAVVTVLFRQIQPGIALMWLAVESAAAFLLAVIAVVEKLFAQAIELRAESELTV